MVFVLRVQVVRRVLHSSGSSLIKALSLHRVPNILLYEGFEVWSSTSNVQICSGTLNLGILLINVVMIRYGQT